MTPESKKVQRGWYYVKEPESTPKEVPTIQAKDGTRLSICNHGTQARIVVEAPKEMPWAGLLRLQSAIASVLKPDEINTTLYADLKANQNHWTEQRLNIDPKWFAQLPNRHALNEALSSMRPQNFDSLVSTGELPTAPTRSILFFESLMNSDLEYNDAEISQGVLHMVSSISHMPIEPLFVKVKMPIEGDDRPVTGLENLSALLQNHQPTLICITLLEGYWEGVNKLIKTIRELHSNARIAVGGVMPTLSPEHVAAHLKEVSFICRGAGEYFMPQLVSILGNTDVRTPLSEAQLYAFSQLDGIITLDRTPNSKILVCGRSDRVVQVENLDSIQLDLQYVLARHLVGGVEICTSRGCIHKCTFCNIIGRESYQARSAESIVDLLHRYEMRYRDLFGENIPNNAWRLHIADDDFACDKARAAQFFQDILKTQFRLSSVQVSVADMCRKEKGKLLVELDPLLCDSILPECFSDHYKNIPENAWIEDHKPRNWSSYLQIGVETFCDKELIRLGKGYRVEHIRLVVEEMAAKRVHVDAYFIQSNSQTSAEDLLEGVTELVRLKIRHPYYFHVRYPPVPHLVSYFPSATHRRHVRNGQTHVHKLRHVAQVENYNEYDYPFVDHDIPSDIWVQAALEHSFFSGENCYSKSLENLFYIWKDLYASLPEGDEKERGRRLLRALDDLPRTLIFQRLSELRYHDQSHNSQKAEQRILALAKKVLGTYEQWKQSFQRFVSLGAQRLVLIPTWQCELRCRYCYIQKQDGRVMPLETVHKGIDLLMSSRRPELILQFFGGEALLEWETLKIAISYAQKRADALNKKIQFVLSTNGWSLTPEKLDWLQSFTVKLELSLDGDSQTQNTSRQSFKKGLDSYQNSIATKRAMIQSRNFFYDVIMVVPPKALPKLSANFQHIAKQNWKRIQINYALGMMWSKQDKELFAKELMKIETFLRERWKAQDPITMINLESDPMNMRLNGEITIDWDGAIHSGNAFLLKGRKADALVLGRVDDLNNFDRYWMDVADNDILLDSTYSPHVTQNNLEVGKIFNSWIRWVRKKGIPSMKSHRSR